MYFDSVETPAGNVVENFLIVRPKISAPGGVVGVCVLPERNGEIGLMKGYRHQLDDEVWQAPAGFIESGESADQAALRELGEETGLCCPLATLQSLGVYYPDAGLVEGRVALFVARNCSPAPALKEQHVEVGAGAIKFFDRNELAEIVRKTSSMGGSTLITCFRYLATMR